MSTPSDGIRDFFARYHAVPATDSGPDFPSASDDALLAWLNGECDLLRRGTGDPRRVILKLALAEAWRRIATLTDECKRNPRDWPGRNTVGRLLAALAANADVLEVRAIAVR
jgi:hypothetical protein